MSGARKTVVDESRKTAAARIAQELAKLPALILEEQRKVKDRQTAAAARLQLYAPPSGGASSSSFFPASFSALEPLYFPAHESMARHAPLLAYAGSESDDEEMTPWDEGAVAQEGESKSDVPISSREFSAQLYRTYMDYNGLQPLEPLSNPPSTNWIKWFNQVSFDTEAIIELKTGNDGTTEEEPLTPAEKVLYAQEYGYLEDDDIANDDNQLVAQWIVGMPSEVVLYCYQNSDITHSMGTLRGGGRAQHKTPRKFRARKKSPSCGRRPKKQRRSRTRSKSARRSRSKSRSRRAKSKDFRRR